MISQAELQRLYTWDGKALHTFLKPLSMVKALQFRRDMQVALAEYRRKHSDQDFLMHIVWLCGRVEKWCREYYFHFRKQAILEHNPQLCLKPKSFVRIQMRGEWENILKEYSY